jgi:hypothetical protein
VKKNPSKSLFKNLRLYTGMSDSQIRQDLDEKEKVLNYMVKLNITDVDEVGRLIAEYYTDKANMMKFVHANKKLED